MKLPDWLTSAILLALSLGVLWHVQSFPAIPGQDYGAAVFPGLAAAGLGVAALILLLSALARLRRTARPAPRSSPPSPAQAGGETLLEEIEHDRAAEALEEQHEAGPMTARRWLALALSVAAIVFYIFFAESLGFILSGVLILSVLMWAYGARPATIVPVAIVATLLIHTGFYKLLRVPLPWGVLQPIAW